MATREQIRAEVERVRDENLDELHELIKQFIRAKNQNMASGSDFLTQLKQIQIEGPEDFAENHDLYLSGEKRVE